MKETKMPPELSAAEIEKVLDVWYCDLALDTGLDFARVAEKIAALVRERQEPIQVGMGEVGVALGCFAVRWLEAPPLVRAAAAAWLAKSMGGWCDQEMRLAIESEKCGLARRTRVAREGAGLFAAISDLFVALCRQADNEADRLGVPGDARP